MIYYVNEAAAGNEVWNVVPFKSIGKIKFGDSRDNVRKIFSKRYDCVPSPSKDVNGDRFRGDKELFHVYYDKNNKVGSVGIYKGIVVKYNGETVFPMDKNSEKVDYRSTGISQHSNMVQVDDKRYGEL